MESWMGTSRLAFTWEVRYTQHIIIVIITMIILDNHSYYTHRCSRLIRWYNLMNIDLTRFRFFNGVDFDLVNLNKLGKI
jgi:hypothetical protein